MKHFFFIVFSILAMQVYCQNNFGIGTNNPSPDAILELKSSTQGVLIPRLSTAQRLAIVKPTNGLMVFDTNFNCIYVYIAPSSVWQSYCPPPVGPPVNSNVQVYTSQAVPTLITSTTPVTVNGLSLTVNLTDTATVILSSNGELLDSVDAIASGGSNLLSYVELYQNSIPILGTLQNSRLFQGYGTPLPPPLWTIWSVSTVLSLLPGTYLFELKAGKANTTSYKSDNFWAALNSYSQNQGIIIAQVIYK